MLKMLLGDIMKKQVFQKRSDETTMRFPRPCFVSRSAVFWLLPEDDHFTASTYPSPHKIKDISFKTFDECKKFGAKLRGKQAYVDYNCIWPFIFFPEELEIIVKQINDDGVDPPENIPVGNTYQETIIDDEIKKKYNLNMSPLPQ